MLNRFFDIFKKAETQMSDIKKGLAENIFDKDGNIRPGVTPEKIRETTEMLNKVAETFNNVAERQKKINEDWVEWDKDRQAIVNKLKKSEIDNYKQYPLIRAFLDL